MKQYELMMILDASLTLADRDALISLIETELADHGAKIISRDHPGAQKLAYRIHGSDTGYYLLYTLEKSGNFEELSSSLNLKKSIWRYMFTKVEA
jgi:ribosomal protein S6